MASTTASSALASSPSTATSQPDRAPSSECSNCIKRFRTEPENRCSCTSSYAVERPPNATSSQGGVSSSSESAGCGEAEPRNERNPDHPSSFGVPYKAARQ
eukprot:6174646-Pleurochrysis_carterae.AAC.1